MQRADYDQVTAINYSSLKYGRTSLPRMHSALTGGLDQSDSDALALGSMFHTAMQNGATWADKFCIRPEGIDRRTKDGKALWAAWVQGLPEGATIIESQSDAATIELVNRMRASIMSHPVAGMLAASSGHVEHAIVVDGRKGMLDKLIVDESGKPLMVVDWKTAQDASPDGFTRACARYGYAHQAAWYINLVRRYYGVTVPFTFIAVESSRPHSVGAYTLMQDQIDAAHTCNERIVTAYQEWAATCYMHHTKTNIEPLLLPEWAVASKLTIAADAVVETPF